MRQIGEWEKGSLSVCFTLLNPSRLLSSGFMAHLGSVFPLDWTSVEFFPYQTGIRMERSIEDDKVEGVKGGQLFSCFSGDKWRIFALESRNKDKGSRRKQILLSSTQTGCSALSGVFELVTRCFPFWRTNQGSFFTTMGKSFGCGALYLEVGERLLLAFLITPWETASATQSYHK